MIKETIGGSLLLFMFLLAYYIFYWIPKVEPVVWERKVKRKELMETDDFKNYIKDNVQAGIKYKILKQSLRAEGIYDPRFIRKLYKKSMEDLKHGKHSDIQGKNGRGKKEKSRGESNTGRIRGWFRRSRKETESRDNITNLGTTNHKTK